MIKKNNNKFKAIVEVIAVAQKRIILTFIALIVVLLFLYAYFVMSAILSTVEYKNIRSKIVNVKADIALLETKYISRKEEITSQLAFSMGLVEINEKQFINRIVHIGRAEQ